jgi:hypothetical protein
MEALYIAVVVGLVGGFVLSLVMAANSRRRRAAPANVVPVRLDAPSPALINMANIKVEGVGGLGMVAAVVLVAIADPRIRLATLIAALFGAGLALVLIAIRRPTGALPSGGDGPGDRSILHIGGDRGGTDEGSGSARSRSAAAEHTGRDIGKVCEDAIHLQVAKLFVLALGLTAVSSRQELFVDADGPDVDQKSRGVRARDEIGRRLQPSV